MACPNMRDPWGMPWDMPLNAGSVGHAQGHALKCGFPGACTGALQRCFLLGVVTGAFRRLPHSCSVSGGCSSWVLATATFLQCTFIYICCIDVYWCVYNLSYTHV